MHRVRQLSLQRQRLALELRGDQLRRERRHIAALDRQGHSPRAARLPKERRVRICLLAAHPVVEWRWKAVALPKGLVTSFGGGGVENLELWETQGEEPLATLIKVLDMSHGVIDPDDVSIYVWPSAHAYDTWEEIPPEAISELLTIHTEEELDRFAEFGGYAGWRLGISETGQWLFFVAGD